MVLEVVRVYEDAHDLARTIDPIGLVDVICAGDIDRGECSRVGISQETVGPTGIREGAHDLAGIVDPIGLGAGCTSGIDRGERPSRIPPEAGVPAGRYEGAN